MDSQKVSVIFAFCPPPNQADRMHEPILRMNLLNVDEDDGMLLQSPTDVYTYPVNRFIGLQKFIQSMGISKQVVNNWKARYGVRIKTVEIEPWGVEVKVVDLNTLSLLPDKYSDKVNELKRPCFRN